MAESPRTPPGRRGEYEHLQTGGLRVLGPQKLTNLGQINVVAGKNNSGKSTLLEALAKDLETGITLTEEFLDSIWDSISQGGEWTSRSVERTFPGRITVERLGNPSGDPSVWFKSDVVAFVEDIQALLR